MLFVLTMVKSFTQCQMGNYKFPSSNLQQLALVVFFIPATSANTLPALVMSLYVSSELMPESSKLENAAEDMQSKLMEDEELRSSVKEAVSLESGCAKALAAKVSMHGS